MEGLAAEGSGGQALAEDALFSMLGYLRKVFHDCRVSSEGGLEAPIRLSSETRPERRQGSVAGTSSFFVAHCSQERGCAGRSAI